ncbi:MAG: hypothetical protein ABJH72_13725 [Reichenbachiella sp.]|uniref:hypothetical protein n=1 Tax=Reichenbachiella sp. TaxID=2184521 RepID=UPI00329792FF
MEMNIEKLIWNQDDFDQMGWHDSHVYALAFKNENFELIFDLDYITEWVHPNETETYFKFWVAPTTLVFKNVHSLNIDLDDSLEILIEEIKRDNPVKAINAQQLEYDWRIETSNGLISFKSVGYVQFIRELPELISTQKIGLEKRGGLSFAETVPN